MTEIILRGPDQLAFALRFLQGLTLAKPWRVTIAPYVNNRSRDQNALYWKWLGTIAKETGNDTDELHSLFKRKYLPPIFVDVCGEVVETRRSTTRLNTKDMSDYMTQVEAFAATTLGIILPHPDDYGR